MRYYTSRNDWYSDWEKDHDDWLEYLAKDVQVKPAQTSEQNTTEETKIQDETVKVDPKQNTEYKQMSFFELFPDGFAKQDAIVKKATPRKSRKSQNAQTETKEEKLIKSATQIEGSWDDLDKVIESLENEAKLNHNVFIDFHGNKLYALVDDRDSCYKKVTGLDYESYCRYEPYIDELE